MTLCVWENMTLSSFNTIFTTNIATKSTKIQCLWYRLCLHYELRLRYKTGCIMFS